MLLLSELPAVSDVIGGKTGLELRDLEFPVGTVTPLLGEGLRNFRHFHGQ